MSQDPRGIQEGYAMLWKSLKDMAADLRPAFTADKSGVSIVDRSLLVDEKVDRLVYNSIFNERSDIMEASRWLIRACCAALDVHPASIQDYYMAKGKGKYLGVTVPAINIRGMTYDVARVVLRAAKEKEAGAVIFELARSEMGYTAQPPAEYAACVMAAAMREGYQWPMFIQGDHFQVKASVFKKDPDKELGALRKLVGDALAAGFYNIDIDSSTVVDLERPTIKEQQSSNFEVAAELTRHIRGAEPAGITVSVGGEIGEVGGKNSTVEELTAFMEGYLETLGGGTGLSKISVQTGTSHGGVVLPDGTLAQVKIDFKVLEELSKVARERYGMSGAVQHGASTLPEEAFDHFPRTGCAEVHLATGFQNIIYDNPKFPADMKEDIYSFIRSELAGEKKESDSDDQFIYKTRKKAFGPFKKAFWDLPPSVKDPILDELSVKFKLLFDKLGTAGSAPGVLETVKPKAVKAPAPPSLTEGL
jgi:fructose/tagatose bisphosphate aldolase